MKENVEIISKTNPLPNVDFHSEKDVISIVKVSDEYPGIVIKVNNVVRMQVGRTVVTHFDEFGIIEGYSYADG